MPVAETGTPYNPFSRRKVDSIQFQWRWRAGITSLTRFLFAVLWKRLYSAQAKRGRPKPSGLSFEKMGLPVAAS